MQMKSPLISTTSHLENCLSTKYKITSPNQQKNTLTKKTNIILDNSIQMSEQGFNYFPLLQHQQQHGLAAQNQSKLSLKTKTYL